jgi:HD-GYP domain-containing protein (c-di-GMP phosphodiesterase class II)
MYRTVDDVHQAQRIRQLQGTYLDTIRCLGMVVALRQTGAGERIHRMAAWARRLSGELGWSLERQEILEVGVYLHDIGTMGVPVEILNKEDPLTKREIRHLWRHPQTGVSLLKTVDFIRPAIPYALYHHERYDGGGYPFGLSGMNIPLEGRVIAILDTFDALTRRRPYCGALGMDQAIDELQRLAGRQLDPELVKIFVTLCPDPVTV